MVNLIVEEEVSLLNDYDLFFCLYELFDGWFVEMEWSDKFLILVELID